MLVDFDHSLKKSIAFFSPLFVFGNGVIPVITCIYNFLIKKDTMKRKIFAYESDNVTLVLMASPNFDAVTMTSTFSKHVTIYFLFLEN